MKLTMIRHGQTDDNSKRLIQGHIDNLLNDTGKQEAIDAAMSMLNQNMVFDQVVSSPLKRAYETARIIKDVINHPKDVIIIDELIERHFGDLDGKTIEEAFPLIASNYQKEGYETDSQLEKRVHDVIKSLYQQYPNEHILAVVHSQVIKALLVIFDPKTYNYVNFTIHNGEMLTFEIEPNHIQLSK